MGTGSGARPHDHAADQQRLGQGKIGGSKYTAEQRSSRYAPARWGSRVMKEIYSWVSWFRELSRKIAEGGEEFLAARACTVPWREDGSKPPLLNFADKHIDPFSFIYYLASYARHSPGRKRVFKGVEEVFGVPNPLHPEAQEEFIFPQPQH